MSFFTYPRSLPGLAYSKVRRPKHNVSVQTHQSGGEVRMSYWAEPLWEVDLTYEVLRDGFRMGRAWDELLQIEGLFLATTGNLTGFQFYDDDDHTHIHQFLGVSDGVTTNYTLTRTRGSFAGYESANVPNGTEAIGFLDLTKPFRLYVGNSSTPVDPGDPTYGYTLSTGTPKYQQLVFNSAPAGGHNFYCDLSYFFYMRFQADALDLEKFMHQLWALKKVTLVSLRF